MNILISGGCKNGKSYYAQHIAKDQAAENKPLYYIATMRPADEEDQARILRHRKEREGWGFVTIEQSERVLEMKADFSGSFLLDSITALLSNEMFRTDGTVDPQADERLAAELAEFARKTGNTVFVSDGIYSDAIWYEELTENYRRGLAQIDCTLAKLCDVVIEVAFGNINVIKGEGLL